MAAEAQTSRGRRGTPRLKGARPRAIFARAERAGLCAKALRCLCAALILSTIVTASAFAYLYSHYSTIVDGRLASGYLASRAGIYAAPRVLRTGQRLTRERLVGSLRRAGYVEAEASRVWSGHFTVDGDGVEIRPSDSSTFAAAQGFRAVRVDFDARGHIASIKGDGAPLSSYTLEPESLADDASVKTAERKALSYGDIPPALTRAILSIEDRRFFEHGALDLWGVARAALSWGGAEDQDFKQGGSTITQQLVKNTYLTPERTLRRKFREAALAAVVERRMSKEDIFALYCNEIYLGQRGSVAVRGVQQAAHIFFGKELKDLSLAEAATIAGMIQSPGRYAPDRRPDDAKARRDTVIAAMLRDGHVTREEARAASSEPVRVAPLERRDATASYFIDYVNRAVESRLPSSAQADGRGLRVYTTLDPELQQIAEESVRRQVEQLAKVFKGRRVPQAALVALDPRTGHVLAMVGGNSYAESQLNRATDARRQPGSVFKPVVYAAALEGGVSPLSLSLDAPHEFVYDGRMKYRPANYGGGYSRREVTLRTALVRSLNVVTVDVAMRTGLTRVADLAERLGLPRPAPYPSLALGTAEATPLEVAAAYTAFANQGRVVRPTPVARVEDASQDSYGNDHFVVAEQVLKPSTSYMLTDMMAAVIDRGTARAARGAVKGVALAGKTGTARDGWFAGYTPNFVCVVWVGFDDGEELGLTGAESALPAWAEFVSRAVELRPELGGADFARPASVVTVEVDPETGALASASCPQRERVAVAPALAPRYECPLHAPLFTTQFAVAEVELEETPVTSIKPGGEQRALPDDHITRPRPIYTAHVQPSEIPSRMPHKRATQVEVSSDGRRRLTNDLTVIPEVDRLQR